MKTIIKVSLLFILGISLASCGFTGIKGSKNVTKETRKINSEFSEIKVSAGVDLHLTQSKRVLLEVEVDDNLHDILITEVEDGILKIYFSENIQSAKSKSVYLSAPVYNRIIASSGSIVSSTNPIKQSEIILDASSGCLVELEVDANRVEIEASSGCNVEVNGIAEEISAQASSGSIINTESIKAKDATAKASSGANVHVYASNSLIADASSGSVIACSGDPKTKTVEESSGGNVSY